MRVRELLQPRDHVAAARAGAVFALVAGAVNAVLCLAVPSYAGGLLAKVLALSVSGVLLAIGWVARRSPHRLPGAFWATVPTIVTAVTLTLGLTSSDASVGGQIWLCWPVLYAASYLRAPVAWAVLVQVVVADAVLSGLLRPPEGAVTDVASVTCTLAVMTWLLVRARDREERLTARLREQAGTDAVTGLATRRVLHERAEELLAELPRHGGLALLLLDVDHFKAVNDTHGHPAGDEVLRAVARRLLERSRPGDVVGRLGGDEFAVLLPGCHGTCALERGEAVRAALAADPVPVGAAAVPVSVSAGFAVADDGAGFAELYA
ncbi:GGDEF domain-containing protein, partial [Kineococcus glutinatus]|uniref:GGDEF domain-containing protein n=1 Tax=Kineococcus glutinatus TaxID=1070872 RepID=UPI0031E61A55